jgi:hypothetical protein
MAAAVGIANRDPDRTEQRAAEAGGNRLRRVVAHLEE